MPMPKDKVIKAHLESYPMLILQKASEKFVNPETGQFEDETAEASFWAHIERFIRLSTERNGWNLAEIQGNEQTVENQPINEPIQPDMALLLPNPLELPKPPETAPNRTHNGYIPDELDIQWQKRQRQKGNE